MPGTLDWGGGFKKRECGALKFVCPWLRNLHILERFASMRFDLWTCRSKISVASLCFLMLIVSGFQGEKSGDKKEERPVRKVHVVAERFSFTPSEIKVKEGAILEIQLSSEDTFHGFRIAAANIDQVIPARGRGELTVLFDAKTKGTYAFECSRPCGAGHTMMRGIIVVK